MELKCKQTFCHLIKLESSNRTFMELKSDAPAHVDGNNRRSNRTFMELK